MVHGTVIGFTALLCTLKIKELHRPHKQEDFVIVAQSTILIPIQKHAQSVATPIFIELRLEDTIAEMKKYITTFQDLLMKNFVVYSCR
jgi:hypothetical protein